MRFVSSGTNIVLGVVVQESRKIGWFGRVLALGYLCFYVGTGCLLSGQGLGKVEHNLLLAQEDNHQISLEGDQLHFSGISSAFLDKTMVDAMIRREVSKIRYCYEDALVNEPKLEGRISIRFTIQPDGLIRNVGIESSTMNSVVVEACLVQVFQEMHFANSMGGTFVLSYPFLFSLSIEENVEDEKVSFLRRKYLWVTQIFKI